MSRSKRPTIVDVAQLAGVSVATVSRAMAGNYPVAEATRGRVEAAIAELGFVANANARALTGAGASPFALVVSELSDPFFGSIARGVELEASARGRLCLLASSHGSPERELEVVRLMNQQRAEVVVLAGAVPADDDHRELLSRAATLLRSTGGALVLLGRPGLSGAVDVSFDAAQGARLATEHLLDLGHRRIVHIGGPEHYPTSELRLAGFRSAIADRGLDPDACPVRFGTFGVEHGRRSVLELMDAGVDFTGVFCSNDSIAQGAVEALRSRGRRVPEDASVTGYDDLPLAGLMHPALTTVRVPILEMARQAVTLGLEHAGTRTPMEPIVLPTELVVRESTAPVG